MIVPLHSRGRAAGLVRLYRDSADLRLDFQDRELLERAASQVCSFILHEQASELLVESRQFEAFNRFTAFMMHDLKNLAAQQELLVSNARKYKGEPEFIDDAIDTLEHSAKKMQRLLAVLAQPSAPGSGTELALHEHVETAVASTNEREPAVEIGALAPATVVADAEPLDAVLQHLIRNAQDASSSGNPVTVDLTVHDGMAVVGIEDRGCGMDEAFIRQRLFRPFDSTKGAAGMGVGAYQAREFARAHGGDIGIDSTPGEGTRVTIRLPVAAATTGGGELWTGVTQSVASAVRHLSRNCLRIAGLGHTGDNCLPAGRQPADSRPRRIGDMGGIAMIETRSTHRRVATVFWLLTLVFAGGCASAPPAADTGQTAAVSDRGEYLIGPGDTLNIFVWRNDDLSVTVPVRPDGKISTPLIEDMVAVGKSPSELARDMEEVLSEYIRNPRVNVIVEGFVGTFGEKVRVLGQAVSPQSIPYRDRLTLLDVMIEVGGLTQFAAGNRSKLVRVVDGRSQEFRLRLDDLVNKGDLDENIPVQPGDVIIIPESVF